MKFLLLATFVSFWAIDSRAEYSECNYINCDCSNLEFGLLTREYRRECRATEAEIKKQCSEGVPLAKLSCNIVAYGPDAFPVEGKSTPSPEENADKKIKELCKRLRDEIDEEEESASNPYRKIIRDLKGVSRDVPGMDMVLSVGDMRAQSVESLQLTRNAEFYLTSSNSVDPYFMALAANSILDSARQANQSGSLADPEAQLEFNRKIEQLINLGMAKEHLLGENENENLEYLEFLQKLHKAGYTAAQLAEMKENDGKKFVEAVVDLFPEMQNPVLNGPMAIALSDQLQWTRDLYKDSTSALDLIAKAIETGHFDDRAYQKISDHLEVLSLQGPWGKETALGALKKWGEQIPLLGKLIKVFVEDPEKAHGQLPDFCRE